MSQYFSKYREQYLDTGLHNTTPSRAVNNILMQDLIQLHSTGDFSQLRANTHDTQIRQVDQEKTPKFCSNTQSFAQFYTQEFFLSENTQNLYSEFAYDFAQFSQLNQDLRKQEFEREFFNILLKNSSIKQKRKRESVTITWRKISGD